MTQAVKVNVGFNVGDTFRGIVGMGVNGDKEILGVVSAIRAVPNVATEGGFDVTVSLRSPRTGDSAGSFLLHHARAYEVFPCPPERQFSYQGETVVTLNKPVAEGVYRTCDGRYLKLARNYDPGADAGLFPVSIVAERPCFERVF